MSTPVLVALVGVGGVIAGAMLTGLVTLATTLLNRQHEQRRWLLDRRLEVYGRFNAAYRAWDQRPDAPSADVLLDALHVEVDQLALLAPVPTLRQAQELLWMARAAPEDPKKQTDEEITGRAEANKTLLFRQRHDLTASRREVQKLAAMTRRTVLGPPERS